MPIVIKRSKLVNLNQQLVDFNQKLTSLFRFWLHIHNRTVITIQIWRQNLKHWQSFDRPNRLSLIICPCLLFTFLPSEPDKRPNVYLPLRPTCFLGWKFSARQIIQIYILEHLKIKQERNQSLKIPLKQWIKKLTKFKFGNASAKLNLKEIFQKIQIHQHTMF